MEGFLTKTAQYPDNDAVFGVKGSLVVEIIPRKDDDKAKVST